MFGFIDIFFINFIWVIKDCGQPKGHWPLSQHITRSIWRFVYIRFKFIKWGNPWYSNGVMVT